MEYVNPEAQLNEVGFDAASGMQVDIITDDGAITYSAAHWFDANDDGDADDAGDRKYPTAYVSGSEMELAVKLNVDVALPSGMTVLVRASASNGFEFEGVQASVSGNGLSATLTADSAFEADLVQYLETFGIDFEVSFDEGETWESAGSSSNRIYVLHGAPQTTPLHTLVHTFTLGGIDESFANDIITGVWDVLKLRNISRINPLPGQPSVLQYYGQWITGGGRSTAEQLLKYGDGNCYAWVDFMWRTLQVGGVLPAGAQRIKATAVAAGGILPPEGFLVANWEFAVAGHSGNAIYTHLAVPKGVWAPGGPWKFFDDPGGYQWNYTEVYDQPGVAGQGGVEDPLSWFREHGLLLINGIYYDPSYGKHYSGPHDFEQRTVSGYYQRYPAHPTRALNENLIGADVNNNGLDTDAAVVINYFGVKPGTDGLFDIAFDPM